MIKKRWLILGILILVMVVGIVFYWHYRTSGRISAIYPVDEKQAILIRDHYFHKYFEDEYVVLMDIKEGEIWSSKLPGGANVISGSYRGMSVGDGVVTVRCYIGKYYAVHEVGTVAFNLTDGKELWRFKPQLKGYKPSRHGPLYVSTLAEGDQLFEAYSFSRGYEENKEYQTILFALDRKTGQLLWKTKISDPISNVLMTPKLLLYLDGWKMRRIYLSRRDGKKVYSHRRGFYIINNHFWYLKNNRSLHAVNLDTLKDRVVNPHFLDLEKYTQSLALGKYKGELVFVIDRISKGRFGEGKILGIAPKSGRVNWRIPLGWSLAIPLMSFSPNISQEYPKHVPFNGKLTRFIPFIASKIKSPSPYRLMVVDLEKKRIAFEGKDNKELLHWTLFSAEGNYYLSRDDKIAVFNGATGELDAAVRVSGADDLLPFQVKDGKLWTFNTYNHFAVLDAKTLKLIYASHDEVNIENILPEMKEFLGMKQK